MGGPAKRWAKRNTEKDLNKVAAKFGFCRSKKRKAVIRKNTLKRTKRR